MKFLKMCNRNDNSGSKQYVKYKICNNNLYKYDYVGDMGEEGEPMVEVQCLLLHIMTFH